MQDAKANVHKIRLVELYPTVEGEGVRVGRPIMLVRLWGCHLTCEYCDSRYAWDEEVANPKDMETFTSGESLVQRIKEEEGKLGIAKQLWVSITGGEPMQRSPTELVDMCLALTNDGRQIVMNTTGTIHRPQLFGFVDFWSISPPLSSSGNSVLQSPTMMRNVEKLLIEARNVSLKDETSSKGQLKFVVSSNDDLDEALQLHSDWYQYHGNKLPIVFQPVQWPDEGIQSAMSRFERIVNDERIRNIPYVRVIPQVHRVMLLNERGDLPR